MYELKKINKRVCIVDSDQKIIYSLPNHMTALIHSRQEMQQKFVDRINNGEPYTKVLLEFTEEIWNRRLKKTHPHWFRES